MRFVDHIEPPCAGGADHPRNLQWQAVQEPKKKDREERVLSLDHGLGSATDGSRHTMKCKWRNVYLGVVLALLLPVSGWAASWEQARPEEVKAFKSGNLQEVKRIVERFGRTFEDPYTLATALDFAASSANVDLMKYLKSKGWLERCHQQAYPCFPLHAAADEGAGTDMLEFLIAEGFQVDGRGPLLMSPIIMAAQNGRFEAVRYLCEAGADPKATNDEGTNVLQLARTRLGAVRLHYDPKEDAKIRANIKKVIQYLESGQCKKK